MVYDTFRTCSWHNPCLVHVRFLHVGQSPGISYRSASSSPFARENAKTPRSNVPSLKLPYLFNEMPMRKIRHSDTVSSFGKFSNSAFRSSVTVCLEYSRIFFSSVSGRFFVRLSPQLAVSSLSTSQVDDIRVCISSSTFFFLFKSPPGRLDHHHFIPPMGPVRFRFFVDLLLLFFMI